MQDGGILDHPWAVFAGRRLGRLAVSLVLLVVATFAMIHLLPGDPVRAALGPNVSAQVVAERRHQLGLDLPLPIQFADYARDLLTGHLGESLVSRQPVAQILAERLPATALLAALAFGVVVLVGIPLGTAMAAITREGRSPVGELAFTASTGLVVTIPQFLLAVGLVFVFAVLLHLLPVAGLNGPSSLVLPVLALASGPAALLARIVRVEALKVLGQDYVLLARSKRLPAGLIYVRHVLPNALTAVLTILGLLLGSLIAGSVLVENVFAWPGLGTVVVQSVIQEDYPVVQATALVLGGAVMLVNGAVDVALGLLDRRSTILES
jgi:ABC-type dipeptide/oligopeptide/nickel transport system permease component